MLSADTITTSTAPSKRRRLSIEQALRWAIRDELPKRRADAQHAKPGYPSISPMFRMATLGGPVDNWSRDPGFPLAMGDPHPDALVIEGQLLALCDTLGQASLGQCPCPLDLSAYPMALEYAEGADLEVLVSRARHDTARWLMTCAIHGTTPSYGGGPVCEPARSHNGKITLWRTVQTPCGAGADGTPWFTTHEETVVSKGDARDYGTFCKLDWVRSGVEVLEEQLRWAYWHAALVYLVPGLQYLASLDVTGPDAPACPWLTPVVERTVLPNLRPTRKVDLATRRPAGRREVRRVASPVRHVDPGTWSPPARRA